MTLKSPFPYYGGKANGGYGSQSNGRGRENAGRETIWFSPHCLKPGRQMTLFDYAAGDEEE